MNISSGVAPLIKNKAVAAGQFFVPKQPDKANHAVHKNKTAAVIIPTYRPNNMTVNLVESILKWHPKVTIVVVDDSTPLEVDTAPVLSKLNWLAQLHSKLIVLRTTTNTLKAGALNYAINYLLSQELKPDAIYTFDDDVRINRFTIPTMMQKLFSHYRTGAVCSMVRVSNKNKNLLTRLQGLEYHGFNITKISDNGFLQGPLVMQGMLTAFKTEVLEQTNGFTTGHLIEDYDMTARLKIKGWEVNIAQKADAWTEVPETIEALWKQRARWTSGGLMVLRDYWRHVNSVFQDFIGHASFLSLISLIILSFVYADSYTKSPATPWIFAIGIISFLLSLIYSLFVLMEYKDRDKFDWMLKLSIVPELIYSNFLTLVLLGSYAFYFFSHVTTYIQLILTKFIHFGLSAFRRVGYSQAWGTR